MGEEVLADIGDLVYLVIVAVFIIRNIMVPVAIRNEEVSDSDGETNRHVRDY